MRLAITPLRKQIRSRFTLRSILYISQYKHNAFIYHSQPYSSLKAYAYVQRQMFSNGSEHKIPIMPEITLKDPPKSFRIICYSFIGIVMGCAIYTLQENLIFGTIAGIVAKTLTAPLERLTTYKQASINHQSKVLAIGKQILREEGVLGFFRGNIINIFRGAIQKGSLFALQDFFVANLFSIENKDTKFAVFMNSLSLHPHSLSLLISFMSGTLAGLCSTVSTYPLDIIKTANQAIIHTKPWPAVHVWYALYGKRGIRGIWVAILPTLCGTGLYYGIKFCVFDAFFIIIRELYSYWRGKEQVTDESLYETEHTENWKFAAAGAMAGISGNCVVFPNNCIRKRMQTAGVCHAIGAQSEYKSMTYKNTVFHMYKNEGGFRRFYNGFGINLVRNAPNSAIQFLIYKKLQMMWRSTSLNAKNIANNDRD